MFGASIIALAVAGGTPARAAEPAGARFGKLEIKPILDLRLRFENVDQGQLAADALTLRLRGGAEARLGKFSLLAEAEATAAGIDEYNAFPFPLDDEQRRPQFATVPDPRNAELNRLQVQFRSTGVTATLGRQRINLDDQRWVGSVGWRQNEQTFDALRGEAKIGPIAADLTYAIRQRTIFGSDAGPRTAYDGDFLFAGAGAKLGPVEGKLFAYLLDYREQVGLANSSQTYGGFVTGTVPLGRGSALALRASYARQSDLGDNPFDYAADYWSVEAGTKLAGFNLAVGREELGSDHGHAVQTPLATLHKFNGWADLFLTTPPDGLEDSYVSVGRSFPGVRTLPGLTVSLAFHQFDSARGDLGYGHEWDASAGVRLGNIALLVKYADYAARAFGLDTRKVWLQAEWAF